ncbi:hypothetical protein HK100_002804 [Physocladia obscura]|uniref:Uncharacterized protein n=1 Tax=Physocladia obscura TaxID=109957 RepID=A0AAD5XDL8_9FUNG|nr:hypothetical protein HK100_002804 [Physocladia obscura]
MADQNIIDARIEAAADRRQSLQLEADADLSAEIQVWTQRSEKATELKHAAVDEKKFKAHASLEDVAAGHARAQIHDAIRESEARFEYKAHQLKSDLAQDRRASQIELVKEKQGNLQDRKHISQETVFDGEQL